MMMKILIDNGHGVDTKGKRSPDERLLEYAYTREIASMVKAELSQKGYDVTLIVAEQEDVPLNERVKRVNTICKQYGSSNCLLVSIHCNAAGAGDKWMKASGWGVYIAPNASAKSKSLARMLARSAGNIGLNVRMPLQNQPYWVQNLAMCRDTNCPAVLTENMFMDNKADVDWLLSDVGKRSITMLHVYGIINYIKSQG